MKFKSILILSLFFIVHKLFTVDNQIEQKDLTIYADNGLKYKMTINKSTFICDIMCEINRLIPGKLIASLLHNGKDVNKDFCLKNKVKSIAGLWENPIINVIFFDETFN